ncbi:laminin subunit alpha [Octopus sinensis]|uniref:Laminin subunit alpha n=1 Tax=Octopus sinensis TaxID=2607531 RepID=A0A6P7U1G2_9MOLL|nr:laminin subunit alpha [Octopus sinensis]
MSDKLCECKERVIGNICDTCKTGYWDLDSNNPLGCRQCECNPAGTVGGINVCDGATGQCMCKVDVVERNCNQCKDGTYALSANNPFGCKACDCNVGGSATMNCNKQTGQCICKPRVFGMKCDKPLKTYFFPTLHQQKYEIEDGYRPGGGKVYFAFNQRVFPDFSWKGYAIMSEKQPEVLIQSLIQKPSLYRLLIRYHNQHDEAVEGKITLTPRIPTDTEQMAMITFQPTDKPTFTKSADVSSILVLNPGKWTISIKVSSEHLNEDLFLDYLVLVPQHYYEATVLQDRITRQCSVINDKGPCLHYQYPELKGFSTILGIKAYVEKNGRKNSPRLFNNDTIVSELKIKGLVDLNEKQRKLKFDVDVPHPGMYVLVVNYHNPHQVKENTIQILGPSGLSGGLTLLECSYSTLCRQVAKMDDEIGVFNFTTTTGTVTLVGNDETNTFIESVAAIPFHEWKQGYIRPTIVCIKVNGVCAGSHFSNPAGFDRIEAESEPNQDRIATDLPFGIWDTSVGLVKLNGSMPTLDVSGTVRTGQQVIVVHYYQPTRPEATIKVTIYSKDRIYTGTLKADFCSSQTGCRGIIKLDEEGQYHVDIIDPELRISFNSTTDADVWLDYIMLVTSNKYAPELLVFQPVDKSADFLSECIDDSLNLKQGKEKLKSCRTRLFALTTDYNNGALYCKCNVDGSLSFSCRAFGGQCKCRPNIIGRDCSACRSGYYGFPRCRRCRCRVGKCDPVDGSCVCPPFVEGAQCDSCVKHTFGYDPYVGCQECNCHPYGVENHNLSCNQQNGQCNCRPSIKGVHCDTCLMGHYGFPHCRRCDCDSLGTEDQVCDQASGTCLCKENTEQPTCTSCRSGAFYLEKANPKGCTLCFCFGTTSSCDHSTLTWVTISDMKNWTLPNTVDAIIEEGSSEISAIINLVEDEKKPLYWSAPYTYLGNKIISYGGQLKFSVEFDTYDDGEMVEGTPDVILMGNNMSLVHSIVSETDQTEYTVDLRESHFYHEGTHGPVQRSQLMMVLVNLEALYIKASKSSSSTRVKLTNVQLDVATSEISGDRPAYTVEQCHCPASYEGSSCEKCAPGHYRHQTTPFLGICSPCQCNGHADQCDPNTGQCLSCRDNTEGRHCERCRAGYHGDPRRGGCSMCTCPLDSESNNFADTCYANQRGLVTHCDCQPGYAGNHCERCASGFYGQPTVLGQKCQPCFCSGNIDPSVEGSCDQTTGACHICTNNSTGPNCELCRHWWYGDAVRAKNCKPCTCDRCGTVNCGEFGTCECKENIIGINCDRCLPNYWGYHDCNGCKKCECAAASVSEQCDEYSGQCECREGVIGQKCDHCQSDYWNYKPTGCQKCQCMNEGSITCDSETGACICQPGFRGVNCSQCDKGWVHIPGKGCVVCDKCTKFLTDELYELSRNITITKRELHSVTVGVTALNSLRELGQSVNKYQPEVTAFLRGENPNLLSLKEHRDMVESLGHQVDVLKTKAKSGALRSHELLEKLEDLKVGTKDVDDLTKDVIHFIKVTVDYLKSLTTYTGPSTNLEAYIKRANILLDEMNELNHVDARQESADELDLSMKTSEVVVEYSQKKVDPEEHFNMTRDKIDGVREKLYDLQSNSRDAGELSSSALNLVQQLNNSLSANAMHSINTTTSKITQTISMARTMFEEIYANDNDLKELSAKLGDKVSDLSGFFDDLKNFIDEPVDEAHENVSKAIQHSDEIQREIQSLDSIYVNTKSASDTSVKAANSYKNIIMSIEDATVAANDALNVSQISHDMSQGVGENSMISKWTSLEIKMNASAAYDITTQDLANQLQSVQSLGDRVEKLNKEIQVKLEQFQDLHHDNYTASAHAIAMEAMETSDKASEVLIKANSIRPEDKNLMSSIPLHHSDTNESVTNGLKQVDKARELLPNITSMIQYILDKKDAALSRARNASLDVKELRKKIELARSQANQILVGLKFSDTAVRLRNPPQVDSSGSYTKVSMHVKTYARNGLLTYIGGPKHEVQTQDYLSLEVADGRVMLRFDLGSGPGIVYHPKQIDDGEWHYIEAERIGAVGSLKVVTDGEDMIKMNGTSGGTNSVLLLRKHETYFFVGGFPQSVTLPDDITRTRFEGAVERFVYNDYPMGLWDFVSAENNYDGVTARLIKRKTFDGYRFDGDSYFELKAAYNVQKKFDISLSFNTFKPDGLLLLMYDTKSQDFASIDMRDGRIVYQYDLGGGRAFIATKERYNDGKWHQVQIRRHFQEGHLSMDSGTATYLDTSPGNLKMLAVKKLFIGGYNDYLDMPRNNLSNFGFNGCIKSLQFNTDSTGFENRILAHKVIPGCPEQIARGVNFPPPGKNYVTKYLEMTTSPRFHLTMKIRTEQSDGLLMFAQSPSNERRYLAIFVSSGHITVVRDNGPEVKSKIGNYNDGSWHYISVVQDGQELTLNINDVDMAVGLATTGLNADVQLYFGGIPEDISLPGGVPDVQFYGCIEDVTINGLFFNFATAKHSPGVRVNICPLDISTTVPSTSVVPATPPPTLPPGQCALPKVPAAADSYSASGHRFGATSNASRWEVNIRNKNNRKNHLSIEFQTMTPDGVLLYAADKKHRDFISVYLKGGEVRFSYNCGSGVATLRSTSAYNDGKWHKVTILRFNKQGTMSIDSGKALRTTSPGTTSSLDITRTYSFGGLSPENQKLARRNLKNMNLQFIGCLKNIKFSKKKITEDQSKSFNVEPCSGMAEFGTFFIDGYVKLFDKYHIGTDLKVTMEVKPRSMSGVLFAVHGTEDFMLVQIVNGVVQLSFDNGMGIISTVSQPGRNNQICNGQWHRIKVGKSKTLATLEVDGKEFPVGKGKVGASSADTNHPLYIGGVPAGVKWKDVQATSPYVGCIRNVKLNNKAHVLAAGEPSGDLKFGFCPTI